MTLKSGKHDTVDKIIYNAQTAVHKYGNSLSIQREIAAYSYFATHKIEHIPSPINIGNDSIILPYYPYSLTHLSHLSAERKGAWCKQNMPSLINTLYKCYEHGFIHNDLRPDNIMLDKNFYPYIIDWGRHTYKIHHLYNHAYCAKSPYINNHLFGWEGTVFSLQQVINKIDAGFRVEFSKYSLQDSALDIDGYDMRWWSGCNDMINLKNIFQLYE